MKFHLLVASAGALALAACGSGEEAAEAPPVENTAALDTMAPAGDAADPSTPQGFVNTMGASDLYEIEAGRIAQEKAQSEDIKQFADTMVMDHTTSSENLMAAAAQAQGVTFAPQLTAMHQQLLTELRDAGADAFDDVYKQQQVNAHQEALNVLQSYAQSGAEEPLTSFASNTATVVEGHLQMANELP